MAALGLRLGPGLAAAPAPVPASAAVGGSRLLVAFSFRAKPGKEAELERLLNDPEAARAVAKAQGATRNALFLKEGRMIRVMEFPEGAKPVPLGDVARRDPRVADFLRRLGPIIEDGFDIDRPETLEAFNRRITVPLAFDVRL